jgi:arginyl-tRNA synthetase
LNEIYEVDFMQYIDSIAESLAQVSRVDVQEARESIGRPKGGQADLCTTLAFSIAKKRGDNPAMLAKKWAGEGKWPAFVKKAAAVGPYLNIEFSNAFWADFLNQIVEGKIEKPVGKRKRAIVEYPSVNPNKPWHVGHLRNALLGDVISNILGYCGLEVQRIDYIDDLGLQVAQSVWGQKNLEAPQIPQGLEKYANKLDHVVGWQYVEVAKRVQDPQVEKQVRGMLKALEEGGEQAEESRKVVENILRAQYQTAMDFGVYHDALIFESDIVREIFDIGMEKIKKSKSVVLEKEGKNAGCWVVRLDGERGFVGLENADKILIRSDGTATYTGKDVVFQMYKFGLVQKDFRYLEFIKQRDSRIAYMSSKKGEKKDFGDADVVVNVIGVEQSYPQQVISAVLKKMGYQREAENSIHLDYEHVVLPEGRFSGRSGSWMKKDGGPGFSADELLWEVRKIAKEKITADYGEGEKERISQAVALGAIRFSFLRTSSNQKITFDYERALSLSGDSGPYIQYAYARALHIIQKAEEMNLEIEKMPTDYAFNEDEIKLVRAELSFGEMIDGCVQYYQVHPLCDYTLELATLFNRFYTTTKVIAETDDRVRSQRLFQLRAHVEMLSKCMDLLGIPKIKKM